MFALLFACTHSPSRLEGLYVIEAPQTTDIFTYYSLSTTPMDAQSEKVSGTVTVVQAHPPETFSRVEHSNVLGTIDVASGDLELSVTDAVPPAGMTEEDTKVTFRGHVTADGFTIDGNDSSGKVKEIDFVRASQEQVNAGVDAIPGGS